MTLFVYMGKEDRDTLQPASRMTFNQMKTAAEEGLVIDNKRVYVKWILCADWKAMALLKGINAANSNSFCLWCYCTKPDIGDFTKDWSTERNYADQTVCLQGEKTKDGRRGYQSEDLLPFIPYASVVPDELHLRMRISNKLLNQVIVWSIDQGSKDTLLQEMRRLKIDFQFSEEQGDSCTGQVKKWTQLAGDQLQTVLRNLDVIKVLEKGPRAVKNLHLLTKESLQCTLAKKTGKSVPASIKKIQLVAELQQLLSSEEQRILVDIRPSKRRIVLPKAVPAPAEPPAPRMLDPSAIQEIWDGFNLLMQDLQNTPQSMEDSEARACHFHHAAKEWAEKFRLETFDEDVIPYIHCLVYHVPEALRRFHYLKDIGIEQVERKNYDQHLAYFQGTSKQGGRLKKHVTKQILERENRLLYYRRHAQDEADS